MTGVLYASAVVLFVVAGVATFIYARAVPHGHRAYFHVVLAGVALLAIEAISIPAVSDESSFSQGGLLVINLAFIGAMVGLGSRFLPPPHTQSAVEGRSLHAWYQQRRGFVAFAAVVLLAGIGLLVVEGIADDAHDAAEDARTAALRVEEVAEGNSQLICSLGELISGSPVARRPDETPREFTERIRLLRGFADDLRALDECDPENPVRVRVPPKDREVIQRGRAERTQGPSGLEAGLGGGAQSTVPPSQQPSPPSGGPPQNPPSGQGPPANPPGNGDPPNAPPPDEPPGLLDPITDPVCDLTGGLGVPVCL